MKILNFKTKRPSKKLNFKKIGLFKIIKKILILNYELALLKTIRLRINIFYISLLKLVFKNAKVNNKVKVEDYKEEFKVEIILDFRVSKRKLKYLIK